MVRCIPFAPPKHLALASHPEDFMNGVFTHIMQRTQKGTLATWSVSYNSYVKTRKELREKSVNEVQE